MRTRTKLAILSACILAAAAVDGNTARGDRPTNPTRAQIEQLSRLIVLPVIADCDSPSMVKLADDLIGLGWESEGIADLFGEALADPSGTVVVRWSC